MGNRADGEGQAAGPRPPAKPRMHCTAVCCAVRKGPGMGAAGRRSLRDARQARRAAGGGGPVAPAGRPALTIAAARRMARGACACGTRGAH